MKALELLDGSVPSRQKVHVALLSESGSTDLCTMQRHSASLGYSLECVTDEFNVNGGLLYSVLRRQRARVLILFSGLALADVRRL